MAKEQKVYMPLMVGDWLKGTRGMKAEVRGVYINLLLFQWDNGYIPSDMEELLLIDPELGKVWDKLKDKFSEIAPGKLQNKKNEEVRAFWSKQRNNGKKGGRKTKDEPKPNPEENPNNNHHNDIDIDCDLDLNNKNELFEKLFTDDQFIEGLAATHRGKDIKQAFEECYIHFSNANAPPRTIGEWKQKLNTWLSNTKHGKRNNQTGEQPSISDLVASGYGDIKRA